MTPQVYEILLVEDDPADAELTVHALRKERLANQIEVAMARTRWTFFFAAALIPTAASPTLPASCCLT